MILVIDNYDSFTFNLVHYLRELGAEVVVVRNDVWSVEQAMTSGAKGFLISPGPGTPDGAGIALDLISACAAEGRRPLLGVCLGHQAIGQSFGAKVVRGHLMHGKTASVRHDGSGIFTGIPDRFTATRYHSLVVENLPECLNINATSDDGAVMGFAHKSLPIHGVQFHPESIATQHGHAMLANFLRMADIVPNAIPNRDIALPL